MESTEYKIRRNMSAFYCEVSYDRNIISSLEKLVICCEDLYTEMTIRITEIIVEMH